MNKNICFFAGHRDAPTEIFPDLQKAVEMCITQYGVTEFLVGNYGNFDRMAAKAVALAKQNYDIKLIILPPGQFPRAYGIRTPPETEYFGDIEKKYCANHRRFFTSFRMTCNS